MESFHARGKCVRLLRGEWERAQDETADWLLEQRAAWEARLASPHAARHARLLQEKFEKI